MKEKHKLVARLWSKINHRDVWFFVIPAILWIIFYTFQSPLNTVANNFWRHIFSGLKDLSAIILASAIFKYLVASNTFINTIEEVIYKSVISYDFLKSYSSKRLTKIAENIEEIGYDYEKETSISQIKNAYVKQQKKLLAKKDRSPAEERTLSKKFIVTETHLVRTILQNGVEIVNRTYDFEMMDNYDFLFEYKIASSGRKQEFLKEQFENNNRFTDYSFKWEYEDIEIKGYSTNIKEPIWSYEEDTGYTVIAFNKKSVKKGDKFRIAFSMSIKDEYTPETIAEMKKPGNAPNSKFSHLQAVRYFTVQLEHYNKNISLLTDLEICLYRENELINPTNENKNLFYRKKYWKVPYSIFGDCDIWLDLN